MLMENNGKLSENDPCYPLLSGMLKHQEKDLYDHRSCNVL